MERVNPSAIKDLQGIVDHPYSKDLKKYGNKIITSTQLGYFDREGRALNAMIAITSEGQELLKEIPILLNMINTGLAQINSPIATFVTPDLVEINFSNSKEYSVAKYKVNVVRFSLDLVSKSESVSNPKYQLKISRLLEGAQSRTYRIIVSKGKSSYDFVSKTPAFIRDLFDTIKDFRQPYLNELLQIQEISFDMKSDFAKVGIRLPTVYFSSNGISLVKFAGDEHLLPDAEPDGLYELVDNVGKYISQKAQTNGLWKNIRIDAYDAEGALRWNNFVKDKQGNITWVDPFYYDNTVNR